MIWSDIWNKTGSALTVNVASQREILSDVEARMGRREGYTVATMNMDHVVKLSRDETFRAAYAEHSHVTADGHPVVWFCRLAGQPMELVTGSDLIAPMLDAAVRQNTPVAFLGATAASLDGAAEALTVLHPGLDIVARIAPPMGFEPEGPAADDCIAQIERSGARLCLLALGAPKQERFAAYAHTRLPQTGFLSIGAGLDFFSKAQTRAPKIVRRLALEWLWRLVRDPARMWRRYASCFAILPKLTTIALAHRFRAQKSG